MDQVKCVFNGVSERDMDVLFMHLFSRDDALVKLFLEKTDLKEAITKISSVELSKTDPTLGESDITVIVETSSCRVGILIENKIDAIAMPEQADRYIKRGNLGIDSGDYSKFYSFIVCPQKYFDSNDEAHNYPFFISYELIAEYLFDKACKDLAYVSYYQQIMQAIDKAKKPPRVVINERANLFFRKYKDYQENNYPDLDLRTRSDANGYWAQYKTRFGNAYILHKIQEGKVDLTFSNCASHMNEMEQIASWLRSHGFSSIKATITGKAGALNVTVPPLDMMSDFDEVDVSDVNECLDAVEKLTTLANTLAVATNMANI